MKNNNTKLTASFQKIKRISIVQLLEMHKVFVQYYHNADLQTFITDMGEKTGVFLIQEKHSNRIVGFSTWSECELNINGQPAIGIFSGDTVIEKQYWGNNELQKAFILRLFKMKIKNPKTPIYWLLISKGYKTYLLLTNNFPKHYPSYKKNNIKLESVVDNYCQKLYPYAYNQEERLLNFGDSYQHLKEHVAQISDDMTTTNPNIRHFTKLNPRWDKGVELPCVGEVNFHLFWAFFCKLMPLTKKKNNKNKHLLMEAS
jgi:hypothetical protein